MSLDPGLAGISVPSAGWEDASRAPRVRLLDPVLDALARLRALFARGAGGASARARTATETTATATLESLMVDHAEAAYRVALSVTRDHGLAEDVTQDAMLKAWGALPTWRGDAPVRNWILRITHNTAISTLRKRRELLADPIAMPEPVARTSVEQRAEDRLALAAFEVALDELDELTRSVVVLREVEGMSYDEIAGTLGVALPTVKTRLLRGRRHLANALDGWAP